MAQEMNFPRHHILAPAKRFCLICTKVCSGVRAAFDVDCLQFPSPRLRRSFKWRNLTFVSKFAAFYAANIELWLHKPPTAKNVDGKLCALFIFSQIEFSLSENTKLLWGF
jgi:hypothetical protein